jgi:hypothetical protein
MSTLIKIPKTHKDLRIKHNKVLNGMNIVQNPTLEQKIVFLYDFTGTALYELKRLQVRDIDSLYRASMNSLGGITINDNPPKVIKLDGKAFEIVNPHKVAAGWHIDFSNTDMDKDPVRMACLFYYPKGELYGITDDNGNLINPINDRYELFKDHLPLEVYLEASAFFLTQLHKLTKQQVTRRAGELKGESWNASLRSLFGRKQYTH